MHVFFVAEIGEGAGGMTLRRNGEAGWIQTWRVSDDSDIPETGAVFTFGKSKFAENLPNKFWVRNDRVCQVACGDEHTCLVAESGRVFTFGSNDWGQLGLGTTNTANRPSCIKSLKHEKVTRGGMWQGTHYCSDRVWQVVFIRCQWRGPAWCRCA
ncbi:hypothetical protein ScPMuIL_012669 [Solemya velum]